MATQTFCRKIFTQMRVKTIFILPFQAGHVLEPTLHI